MRTLAGVDAPEDAPASGQSDPIVVPSAGGTFDAGVARAITQLPRYDGSETGDQETAAIPRAPKLPSESGGHEPIAPDQRAAAGEDEAGAATADGEPAAPKPSQGTAAPVKPGAAPRATGGGAPHAAARPPSPPRRPGRDAAPGSAPAQDNQRDAAAAGSADQGAGAAPSAMPPAPSSSSRGTRRPAPAAGRPVPPPPVPVRFPAIPAKKPAAGARAPNVPDQTAAGAKALVRLGSLPAPPPLPPEAAPRAAQPAAAPASAPLESAAPASSAAITAITSIASPAPRTGPPPLPVARPLPGGVEDPAASDGRELEASRARSEAAEPSAAPYGGPKEPTGAPVPNETKRSPLPVVDDAVGRREHTTVPSAGIGPGSPQGRPATPSWSGPSPGSPGAQRTLASADAVQGQLADRSPVTGSSNGAPALDPRALATRRPQPPRGWLASLARGDGPLSTAVPVRVSSLIGIGAAAVLMSVVAFFAGRRSVAAVVRAPAPAARPALGAAQDVAQDVARAAMPAPPKPCWVARQPRQWAPLVAKSIPFEVTATRSGKLAVGYAKSAREAVGLEVDPATGERNERFSRREAADVVSISPVEDSFAVLTAAQQAIRSPVNVPGPRPFIIGLADGAVVAADSPEATPSRLWPVQGDEPLEAPRALAAGPRGYALAFRRERSVWAGWLDEGRRHTGELTRVMGSGGAVGKPSLGWNERNLAVVFADRPADGRWEIRAGQAPAGTIPTSTQVIPLPTGGPGGDAFAPDIAGLSGGRWLLVWTEGPPGSRAMRAQTLAPDFTPVGDPIALSPPAGNFGQGVLGVSAQSGYVGVVFLSKPAASYELWGVILQCG